jgi:hypothetical protein
MAKISMKARKEVLNKHKTKYRKARKKEKSKILDVVCESTGLSRDRAARLLAARPKSRSPTKTKAKSQRGRKRIYDLPVIKALKEVWTYMDFVCGKRLHEGIEDMLDALIRFDEITYDAEVIRKLRQMSAATMDRLLKKDKEKLRLKGISTTKPGTLLKRNIPIRLGQDWDDAIPGFVEVDLVAHCGPTTAGEYVNTLNVTDICTGWTEPVAVLNKAQRHVFAGLMDVEQRQPFPLAGIDSDNGSEFINHELYRFCKEKGICFTRSRTYTKNDSCHVEQKNWSLVRRHIGYIRFEGQAAVTLLNAYYDLLRLQVNFFLPSTKLIEKRRDGARVYKHYEKPLTPYRRVLAQTRIPDVVKKNLTELFLTINPSELVRGMIMINDKLGKLRIQD